jgi:peroxiredoxin family protein
MRVEPWHEQVRAVERRLGALETRLDRGTGEGFALLVFSGELDRLLAAFTVATGAAACGMPVSMFFTFWGAAALKKSGPQTAGKSLVERMFGWMLPGGLQRRRLSRLDMGGAGRALLGREMQRKQMPDLAALIALAAESGVRLYVCDSTLHLMGIRPEELIDYPGRQLCGVAQFVDLAATSRTSLVF